MSATALQQFVRARTARLQAEKEEKKIRGAATSLLQGGKPKIVRVDGTTYMLRIDGNKAIQVVECEDHESSTSPADAEFASTRTRANGGPVKLLTFFAKPEMTQRLDAACEEEGINRSQWAEQALAGAYAAWMEGDKIPPEPGPGKERVSFSLPVEIAQMVAEFAEAECPNPTRPEKGPSMSAAVRRLVMRALP